MIRRAIGPDRFVFLGVAVLGVVFLAILYMEKLPKVPLWLLGAGWIVLALLLISTLLMAETRRTKALRRIAAEFALEFSEVGDEASLRAVFEPRTPEGDQRELQAILSQMGPQPEEVVRIIATQFAKAKATRTLQQSELRRLTLFSNLEHPGASNVMGGTLGGGEALIFDYSFHEPGIERTSSASQTVACFRFRGRKLPSFELSRQNLVGRISSAIGAQDLNFESHPEFSKRFRLRSDDENAVRSFFDPGVMRFFESLGPDFQQTIEVAGECIVVYRLNHRVRPAEIQAFVNEASAVASVLGTGRRIESSP